VVTRFRAEYAAAEARLRLELRKQYPDITLSPGFSQERDESSVVVGFGLPIPVWNANREGIAAALGQREIARARVEGSVIDVLGRIAQADAKFHGAQARRERLMAVVAPEVDSQIAESLALLRSGELNMQALFQVLTQTYDVKREILEALAEEQASFALISALIEPITFDSTRDSHEE
jgi:outer membrane protein TolC